MKKGNIYLFLAMISFLMFIVAVSICTYLENNVNVLLENVELSWIPAIIGVLLGYLSLGLFLIGVGKTEKNQSRPTNKYQNWKEFEIKDANACIEVTKEETEKTYFKNVTIAKGFYQHLEEMGFVPALYVKKKIHTLTSNDVKSTIVRVY